MAMPRLPGVSGCFSRTSRPAFVSGLGLGMQVPPQVCIMVFRIGFCSKLMRTMNTLHSRPMSAQANDEGAAPLAGAGFGGELLDAELLVVPCLGDGGVRLVAPGRGHAFVLIINARRRAQGFFEMIARGAAATAASGTAAQGLPPVYRSSAPGSLPARSGSWETPGRACPG